MSVVEQREPTTRLDDTDEVIHLLVNSLSRTACGAPRATHTCSASQTVYRGESCCPGCGGPVCVLCQVIAEWYA